MSVPNPLTVVAAPGILITAEHKQNKETEQQAGDDQREGLSRHT